MPEAETQVQKYIPETQWHSKSFFVIIKRVSPCLYGIGRCGCKYDTKFVQNNIILFLSQIKKPDMYPCHFLVEFCFSNSLRIFPRKALSSKMMLKKIVIQQGSLLEVTTSLVLPGVCMYTYLSEGMNGHYDSCHIT